jgi:Domain of unknown function (DUF4160)
VRWTGETQPLGLVYHDDPTVLVVAGLRVRILLPPREHPPPHVHVTRGSAEVVLMLPDGRTGVVVLTVYRMRDAAVIAAVRLVVSNADLMLRAWRTCHGDATTE